MLEQPGGLFTHHFYAQSPHLIPEQQDNSPLDNLRKEMESLFDKATTELHCLKHLFGRNSASNSPPDISTAGKPNSSSVSVTVNISKATLQNPTTQEDRKTFAAIQTPISRQVMDLTTENQNRRLMREVFKALESPSGNQLTDKVCFRYFGGLTQLSTISYCAQSITKDYASRSVQTIIEENANSISNDRGNFIQGDRIDVDATRLKTKFKNDLIGDKIKIFPVIPVVAVMPSLTNGKMLLQCLPLIDRSIGTKAYLIYNHLGTLINSDRVTMEEDNGYLPLWTCNKTATTQAQDWNISGDIAGFYIFVHNLSEIPVGTLDDELEDRELTSSSVLFYVKFMANTNENSVAILKAGDAWLASAAKELKSYQ